MVSIKSQSEIALMREAGKILAKVHEELKDAIRPGMSTLDIDFIIYTFLINTLIYYNSLKLY